MKRFKVRKCNQELVENVLIDYEIDYRIDAPSKGDVDAHGNNHPCQDNPGAWSIIICNISGNEFHKYVVEATYTEPVAKHPSFAKVSKNGNIVAHQYVSSLPDLMDLQTWMIEKGLPNTVPAVLDCLDGLDFDSLAAKHHDLRIRNWERYLHISVTNDSSYDNPDSEFKRVTVCISFAEHLKPALNLLKGRHTRSGECVLAQNVSEMRGWTRKEWKEAMLRRVNDVLG